MITIDLHIGQSSKRSGTVSDTYPLIPVHYIAQINDYLIAQGVDTLPWLHSAGLTRQDIIEDSALLKYQTYENLILAAMALDGEQDIGLKLGQRLSINSHGTLGFALLNCSTVAEILQLFARYLTTRTPLLNLHISYQEDSVVLKLQELYDIEPIRRCFFEAVVVTVANILKTVLPQHSVLTQAQFPYQAPDYLESYQQVLGTPVLFDSDVTRLTLDKRCLTLRLEQSDQHTLHQARALCEQELTKVNQLQSIASRVRLLLMNSRENFLSLQQISERLSLTPRTLHRRLEAEGNSYQSVLEDVRHTLAKQYLQHHHHNVKHIAYLLGYADVANFRRAFKRWQGQSPSEFRQSTH